MALNFHPEPGMVLICDFTTGFRVPEIVKRRPVVVISPRRRRASISLVYRGGIKYHCPLSGRTISPPSGPGLLTGAISG